MKESRWLRWMGPGVVALIAVGSIASTTLGAGQRPWTNRACADEAGARVEAARSAEPVDLGDLRSEAWYRLDPQLDRAGALEGQRLALGVAAERSSRIMDLPPESFAAGPFGRIVLVGSDDGTTSRLEAIDVAAACSWTIAQEAAVVRRATIDPSDGTIYEMQVDRATRADLGIWARPLDGLTPAREVLEPIAADARFGRTFSTEFTWDVAGRVLAVQSCGEEACRTRVIDPAGGEPRTIADPDLGALIGLDGKTLVAYAVCPGLPCPILAVDVETGHLDVLADAAALGRVIPTPDGSRLVHEVLDGSGVKLRFVALDGSSSGDLGRVPDGLRLLALPGAADAATRVPAGWVLLAPGGRLPSSGPDARTPLRHLPDGTTVGFDEVSR